MRDWARVLLRMRVATRARVRACAAAPASGECAERAIVCWCVLLCMLVCITLHFFNGPGFVLSLGIERTWSLKRTWGGTVSPTAGTSWTHKYLRKKTVLVNENNAINLNLIHFCKPLKLHARAVHDRCCWTIRAIFHKQSFQCGSIPTPLILRFH